MTEAQSIVEAIKSLRLIPPERDLWDGDAVASYLKRSVAHTMNKITVLPSFPKAIRLLNDGKGRSQPLYKAIEVMQWAESYQEKSKNS
jgi:hypothetical protein